jgi:hypothetical protein
MKAGEGCFTLAEGNVIPNNLHIVWFRIEYAKGSRVDFGGCDHPNAQEKEPTMLIVGLITIRGFQQIASVDRETGNCMSGDGSTARIGEVLPRSGGTTKPGGGTEASGRAHWFERLLAELNLKVVDCARPSRASLVVNATPSLSGSTMQAAS